MLGGLHVAEEIMKTNVIPVATSIAVRFAFFFSSDASVRLSSPQLFRQATNSTTPCHSMQIKFLCKYVQVGNVAASHSPKAWIEVFEGETKKTRGKTNNNNLQT